MKSLFALASLTVRYVIKSRLLIFTLLLGLVIGSTILLMADISLDQNRRVVTDFGLAAVTLTTILMSIMATITTVVVEQERGTLLLIMSKPISTGRFILGKFIGLAAVSIIFELILAVTIFGLAAFSYQLDWIPIMITLLFGWLETAVLISIALFFAAFTQIMLAAIMTIALFFIGHSLALIVAATDHLTIGGQLIGRLLYYVLPNLEKFNLRELYLPADNLTFPYYLWGIAYAGLYVLVTLFLAQVAMRRREW